MNGVEMSGLVASLALGAAALWVSLAIALVVAWVRRTPVETLREATPTALLVLTVQVLHFTEQFSKFYQDRLFVLLNIHEWPDRVYVALNLGWISVWVLACAAALRGLWPFPVATLLWFLGIAALLNGAVAPALSILTWSYFPGLLTSPFLWLAGLMLVRKLRA